MYAVDLDLKQNKKSETCDWLSFKMSPAARLVLVGKLDLCCLLSQSCDPAAEGIYGEADRAFRPWRLEFSQVSILRVQTPEERSDCDLIMSAVSDDELHLHRSR